MPVSTGANANINIRVDSDVKNKAQDVFSALGLDMTSAINIFLRQAIVEGMAIITTDENIAKYDINHIW